ncbi:YciI family protein [Fodinicurvata sp. EGI_FJ10296]|uniref:YciI family protein n=1 Tax=Fodinicurvata sp. EGI_FJ10296 TaxID=3231908 RepID=UPI0034556F3B
MHFVIQCTDKPGSAEIRRDNRQAHLAHLERHADQVVAAGPTLDDSGEAMTGSVLVMTFPDRAAVDAFCADDPYARAGLFESVTITPWRKVFPK